MSQRHSKSKNPASRSGKKPPPKGKAAHARGKIVKGEDVFVHQQNKIKNKPNNKTGNKPHNKPINQKTTSENNATASQIAKSKTIDLPERRKPAKTRQSQQLPVILTTPPSEDYALLDSGSGEKLERYGHMTIVRPEAQAFWQKRLDERIWKKADAIFTGDTDEDGMGRWNFPKNPLDETWPMKWQELVFLGRFTSFRHVGVFPEQAAHWSFMEEAIAKRRAAGDGPVKVLNLFGYTGIASLVAARAGAQVTHVDASKKAIGWAKENQELAGMDEMPIRWICDDAVKFCEREIRRGNQYDAILLDPPKFGRGPKGEVWQLFESLPHMVDLCAQLMSQKPLFIVLTSYSIRSSFYAMHELFQEVFGELEGEIQSGELVIETKDDERLLSTSLFSRWIAPELREREQDHG